jgi:hypothetical protein
MAFHQSGFGFRQVTVQEGSDVIRADVTSSKPLRYRTAEEDSLRLMATI